MIGPPIEVCTLPAALEDAAARGRGELVFHLDDGERRLTAAELAEEARARAHILAAAGIGRGDRVALLGPNRPEWAAWAYGIWTAGACLVPIGLPVRLSDADVFAERLAEFLRVVRCRLLIYDPALAPIVPAATGMGWDETRRPSGGPLSSPDGDDLAVLQFTSGSTAVPKGAMLTHRAILAEARGRTTAMTMSGDDRMVGWLPFFHDMGLFLYLAYPCGFGLQAHLIPTERFARDPAEWLRLVSRVRATCTLAPPSGWAAAARALRRDADGIDLSCLTLAGTGAEPLAAADMERISAALSVRGLERSSFLSGYGLAETTLGVTSTRRGGGIWFDRVDFDALRRFDDARPAGDPENIKLVATCGRPFPDVNLRIGDESAERKIGEVLVQGPSVMRGYDGEDVPNPFMDGWLRTGDLGYLSGGELFITGRLKDMMIVLGHNYYPEDFEWAAARVPGVRAGRCVAFSRTDADGKVVVLIEGAENADPRELAQAVRNTVGRVVGLRPAEVLVVPRGTIEKTTSGKLRRSAMKDAYTRGELPTI